MRQRIRAALRRLGWRRKGSYAELILSMDPILYWPDGSPAPSVAFVDCPCEPFPVCDFCEFYNFNGDKDGAYTGDGRCEHPAHPRPADPEDGCDDYRCAHCSSPPPKRSGGLTQMSGDTFIRGGLAVMLAASLAAFGLWAVEVAEERWAYPPGR